ncbi:MAG: dihydropteroate synthase [Pirellulales bacterium]|nr:dihydropteroate synthase [Pirellulales bacterium]
MPREHIHFVTGRLAEPLLRRVLEELAPRAGFEYTIDVLKISVAALLSTEWVAPRVSVPPGAARVVLPGYCSGDLVLVRAAAGVDVVRGPKDLRRLPEWFGGGETAAPSAYGEYDIEILAEINHANRLDRETLLSQAADLRESGADVIDVGCTPGEPWSAVGDAIRALRDAGHRIAIDSFDPQEVAAAVRSGAELVLSVNATNRQAAADWGVEVVAVPDVPADLAGLDATVQLLDAQRVPYRVDPILEPIGFGFAASLQRYFEVRRRWPHVEMLMGIGNLTELTDVDSAGVNVLLLAICQELGIRSVLTTQVINWARGSVRECDLARRLVHYAVEERALPKHVEPRLVMLRDPRVLRYGTAALEAMAEQIKDYNFRLFAEDGQLHALAGGQLFSDDDPFALFARMVAASPKPLTADHAFYLGYELSKAVTALTLGKDYRQDQALDWGLLTRPEKPHRQRPHDGQGAREDAGGEETPP